MDIKQILWGFVLQNGYHTTGKYSYYGGDYDHFDANLAYTYNGEKEIYHTKLLTRIKKVGINWIKTTEPIGESVARFEGTFNESSESEWLIGDLYLLDGSLIKVAYNDPDGMGSYIKKMVQLMSTINSVDNFMKDYQ